MTFWRALAYSYCCLLLSGFFGDRLESPIIGMIFASCALGFSFTALWCNYHDRV
jgi:hypothetical protein